MRPDVIAFIGLMWLGAALVIGLILAWMTRLRKGYFDDTD